MKKNGPISELVKTIQETAKGKSRFVIALAGFGGSGKSSAAKKLAEALGNTVVIPLDQFIINRLSERSADWDGFDWTRLTNEVLQPIKNGSENITYSVYDWSQNKIIGEKNLELPKYIIIEGCGLIRQRLGTYFDFSIWIDLPLELAGERGSTRDREEYKVDHDELWKTIWIPNDRDYFEKHQPAARADFLLKV
jgi:uridine kinase